MNKLLAVLVAAVFAMVSLAPLASAADKEMKKEQVHKGTPEQGSVQKKDQKKVKQGQKKAEEKK